MTTVIAAIEFKDAIALVAVAVVWAIFKWIIYYWRRGSDTKRLDENVKLLARQTRELQRQVDVLIQHQGIEMPPPPANFVSPEVEQLAQDPKTKIAAIKLYMEENPGTDLRQANDQIIAIYNSKK